MILLLLLIPSSTFCHRIIIDTDGVTDDVRAIAIALTDSIIGSSHEIVAITTVRGGVNSDQAALNVARILKLKNKTIPIYKGADEPLIPTGPLAVWEEAFGSDGLGDVPDETMLKNVWENETASAAILRLTRQFDDVVLVCIGPLTNIAMSIKKDPGFVLRPRKVAILGGNYMGMGNNQNNNTAEFNFYSDPEAAQIVLSLMQSDMVIIPLETISSKGARYGRQINFMEYLTINSTLADFLNATSWKTQEYMKTMGQTFVPMDDLAVVAVLNPAAITKTIRLNVNVELAENSFTRGQVVVDFMSAVYDPTVDFYTSTREDNGYGFPLRTFVYDYDPFEVNYMLKQMSRD